MFMLISVNYYLCHDGYINAAFGMFWEFCAVLACQCFMTDTRPDFSKDSNRIECNMSVTSQMFQYAS